MALRVLIAPDKFKGTLTARAAAEAIARGWRRTRPGDTLDLLSISDGGDGFGGVISRLLRAQTRTVASVDAAHRRHRAQWWWEPKSRTAIIESANIIGLAQLPPGKFHPFALDTFGLGAVFRRVVRAGARWCVIGIGGSATNDAGFGVALALGWKFLDAEGKAITSWTELHRLSRLHPPPRKKLFEELIVAVDVQNPLLGARGCTRIYGPQKGLKPQDFPLAEKCLRQVAKVTARQALIRPSGVASTSGRSGEAGEACADNPGAGAAGGLGFGLRAFFGARLEPGFELFARMAQLTVHLEQVDLVITGEGAMDKSTMMGKGVGEIAKKCRELNIHCIGLAGAVSQTRNRKEKWFVAQHGLTELTTVRNAKARAAFWLEQLAERVAAKPLIQSLPLRPQAG